MSLNLISDHTRTVRGNTSDADAELLERDSLQQKAEEPSRITCVRPRLSSCWSRLQSGKLECSAPSACPVKTWPGQILSLSSGSNRC